MAPADDWSLTEFRPKDSTEIWYFRKNLAPAVCVGDPQYRYLAYLTVGFEPYETSGRPSRSDYDDLIRIEEQELMPLLANAVAVHIGSVLKPGMRDILLYTRDPAAFEGLVERLQGAFPHFDVSGEVVEDSQWTQYEDLP